MKKETFLYVLLLPHMDKEYGLSYKVKFGFTENFEQRMKAGYEAYYGEDGYQVLHVYKGNFTLDDEFTIKQHLQKYSLFKNEWFKCCPEVLEFFNTYNTSEKLKQRISEIPTLKKSKPRYYKVNYMLLDYIVQEYYGDLDNMLEIHNKQEELRLILRKYNNKDQFNYLKEMYGFILDNFYFYEKERLNYNSNFEVNQKIEEFNQINRTNDKIKFLVEYSEIASKENFGNLLELIPGKYKDYFQIVGIDIIKAYGCEESKIKKAWMEKVSNSEIQDDVVSEIYKTFAVGKRYTKVGIKDALNKLYQKLGYQQKAKATDLEVYYIMKYVKFQEDGKWVNGFELIGKR